MSCLKPDKVDQCCSLEANNWNTPNYSFSANGSIACYCVASSTIYLQSSGAVWQHLLPAGLDCPHDPIGIYILCNPTPKSDLLRHGPEKKKDQEKKIKSNLTKQKATGIDGVYPALDFPPRYSLALDSFLREILSIELNN